MGGNESSQGSRKVSFELDEQDRVRVLQGIRLSEDVVNRMKDSRQYKRDPSFPPPSSPQASEGTTKLSTGVCPPTADALGRKPSEAEEELYKRYEQEQAMVQEELLRLAKREREATSDSMNVTLQREKDSTNEEKQKADHLTQELQWKEAELKQKDTFYKEQLARIEKKNAEIYKLTSEQYHEAVTKAEDQIRRRNTQPICGNLQAEILKCYNENKNQVLNCSELVKEYQRCVSLAQKTCPPLSSTQIHNKLEELLVHFE